MLGYPRPLFPELLLAALLPGLQPLLVHFFIASVVPQHFRRPGGHLPHQFGAFLGQPGFLGQFRLPGDFGVIVDPGEPGAYLPAGGGAEFLLKPFVKLAHRQVTALHLFLVINLFPAAPVLQAQHHAGAEQRPAGVVHLSDAAAKSAGRLEDIVVSGAKHILQRKYRALASVVIG